MKASFADIGACGFRQSWPISAQEAAPTSSHPMSRVRKSAATTNNSMAATNPLMRMRSLANAGSLRRLEAANATTANATKGTSTTITRPAAPQLQVEEAPEIATNTEDTRPPASAARAMGPSSDR